MQDTAPAPHERIFSIVMGLWYARALAVATELELPELLAEKPLRVEELATRTQTDPSALFRLLRALASIGIFTEVRPRVFSNTATSESLRKGLPGSQWGTVRHCLSKDSGPFEAWNELLHALRTGGPSVEKVYGYDYWELLKRSPQANESMNEAMRSVTTGMTPAVTAAYDWSRFPLIADIGGGIGTQLVSILDAAPSSRGILFDKPHLKGSTIPHARIEFVSGDFFSSVPAADAYLLRWILHDWTDADAARILACVRRVIKPTGRLVVVESVIPEAPAFSMGKWIDLQMLVCVGGRERTETEYRTLLAGAGFDLQEVIATGSSLSVLVARPV